MQTGCIVKPACEAQKTPLSGDHLGAQNLSSGMTEWRRLLKKGAKGCSKKFAATPRGKFLTRGKCSSNISVVLSEEFVDMEVFQQKEPKKCQAHTKLAQPFQAPELQAEIRAEKNTGEKAKNPVESLQWRRRPEIADFCPLSWSSASRGKITGMRLFPMLFLDEDFWVPLQKRRRHSRCCDSLKCTCFFQWLPMPG